MNFLKIGDDVCRICVKKKIKLNWNDAMPMCGLSYKDCYYKYTQLEDLDSECYPTSLCEMCANELANAHMLFEKALESFNFLKDLRTKQLETKYEIQSHDEVDKTLLEIVDKIPVCDNERISERENEFSDCEQMSVEETVTVEPSHFIDIQQIVACAETTLEEHLRDISNAEVDHKINRSFNAKFSKPSSTKAIEKSRKHDSININIKFEQHFNKCYNTKLPNPSATKKADNKMNNMESLDVLSLQPNISASCETKSEPAATKPKKSTEKYLCSYCSLILQGAGSLATHEATHNENRERTEICPKCGVKLYTKCSLTVHLKTHDENRQKNFKCEFCGNSFYNRGTLNVHRRKHLGLMVKCQLCNKEFCRQVDLDRHLLRHSVSPLQKNAGKKKYTVQCQYCNKSVGTDRWKGHLAAHLDQPQMKCKICDRNFFSRTNCTKHLRRFHLKNVSEYDNWIYYYVDRKTRASLLMMKQQFNVQPRKENL